MLGYIFLFGDGVAIDQSPAEDWLFGLGVFNLLAGYVSAMALGIFTVSSGNRRLAWQVVGTPLFWMMKSIAGYRALWQPAFAPFLREKTPHDGRRSGPVNAED